jgi:hypothetical protein
VYWHWVVLPLPFGVALTVQEPAFAKGEVTTVLQVVAV